MGTYASLVVATFPRRRALTALRRAARSAAAARQRPDVDHCRAAQAARFRSDVRPPFDPGRVAVMTWARSTAVLEEVAARIRPALADGADETWTITLQPVSVHGDWFGFVPDVDDVPALSPAEPAVVLINGVLRPRYLAHFTRDNARVGAQLETAPGYLGGLGLSDTPLTTSSLSCWRSRRDSRAFAFGAGHHRSAAAVDLAQERHRTTFFVRFRPLASDGTLDGRDPFEEVELATS